MSEAQRMWDAAIAIARAFTQTPEYKAYLAGLQERRRIARQREEAEEKRRREARAEAEAAKSRARAYDIGGCGDPCVSFGIMDGCKPWCPVFKRGECSIQEENAQEFAERGWS